MPQVQALSGSLKSYIGTDNDEIDDEEKALLQALLDKAIIIQKLIELSKLSNIHIENVEVFKSAFFLVAVFLGIMLFGREWVSRAVHTFASLTVAVGTSISAFWILSLNSWMQTPSGYSVDANGVISVVSWFNVVFNPSFPYRLTHMLLIHYFFAPCDNQNQSNVFQPIHCYFYKN